MNWQNKPWADLSPFERAMFRRDLMKLQQWGLGRGR